MTKVNGLFEHVYELGTIYDINGPKLKSNY